MSADEGRRTERRGFWGGVIALGVIVALCFWAWSCDRRAGRLDHDFDRVTVGMTDRQAIALLGAPKWRGRCGTSDDYPFIDSQKGSIECLVYASPFAPLNPYYPVVFLDRDNRVIDKYAYASP